ncbi:Crp/Fnr family transcriptional regulator [Vagococcus penaei]|uniref:Crp/Fnr family transcriptional regulator n=1 Tax=Vagococcus penaei TaxID=633807 RepID=A0A1Q2D6L6_9ENTE|nr:Crp/Fnr family transcriptional regulator [Vagococcus penaei]AQP53977.1 Crp/Fnr family transcriptional regulator [Vagococcus penaei]RST99070.1 Crp/Fnr family transcriptional regulator [Vagococcus penaei]
MTIEEIGRHQKDFCYISDQDIKKMQSVSIVRSYKKGQVLFDPGDTINAVYFLKSGVIRLEKTDPTCTFFYLHYIKSKQLFPRVGLFTDKHHFYSAIAHTDIEVISIPIDIFSDILSNNSYQLKYWITKQSEMLKLQIIKIQKGTLNNADTRVTATLALLCKELGEKQYPRGNVTIPCPVTINQISQASGTTRETTSTIIKKLIKEKRITYSHKYLNFLDAKYFTDFLVD